MKSISIHAPLAGRDRNHFGSSRIIQISIHAPLAGRDRARAALKQKIIVISIHAPLAGRDTSQRDRVSVATISIHAPLAGRDLGPSVQRAAPAYFNPRAPCGARRTYINTSLFLRQISIHAPLAGRDDVEGEGTGGVWISIHAPLAGRDVTVAKNRHGRIDFNPRAPCGARLENGLYGSFMSYFNPRAPCGARPGRRWVRAESNAYFNPRAPCGARPADQGRVHHLPRFQSTRPLRGATVNWAPRSGGYDISIHAPLAGRDGVG